MADVTAIGTNQTTWTHVSPVQAKSGNPTSRGNLAHVTSTPTGTGRFIVTLPTGNNVTNVLALAFFGDAAANITGVVRIWGLSKIQTGGTDERLGDWLADLTVTVGATALTGGVFSGTNRAVDTIAVDEDRSNTPPGIRLVGDVDAALAVMMLDSMGFSEILVEFSQTGGTQNNWGLLWRAF